MAFIVLSSLSATVRGATTLRCATVASAGGVSSSPSFVLAATLGQPLTGTAVGTTLLVRSGFWSCDSAAAVVAVSGPTDAAPVARLHAIAPNPFGAVTSIAFDVASPAVTTVRVYDTMGRRVRTLVESRCAPGRHHVEWDGRDARGERVVAGVYYCHFHCGETRETRRIALVR